MTELYYRPVVNGFDECERIIHERSILLDMADTGCHYQLSDNVHTAKAYLFPPMLERATNRKRLAERLFRGMWESDVNPREDINVLVGLGIAAMPLVYTLQDMGALEHTRAIYMEERNQEMVLGPGFSLRENEKVFLVHLAAVSFRRIWRAIGAMNCLAEKTGIQPCVQGFAVLIDRSPDDSSWRRDFCAFKKVVGIRSPIVAYPAAPLLCPLCLKDVPLVDLRGLA